MDRLLQDFAEIASDWFWETDAEHRFTYFSARFSEVTGVDAAAFLGRRRIDFRPSGDEEYQAWARHLKDLEAQRSFRNFVYRTAHPSTGHSLWVKVSGQPKFDGAGVFIGYRGVGTDVTTEREAQAALERTNAALAARNNQLIATQSELEHRALHDALTGLPNRRYLERVLQEHTPLNGRSLALLHIDLDRFKQINDTLGHAAGDEVLKRAAQVLRDPLGERDFAARIGGDEFVILCPDADDVAKVIEIGDKVVEQMAEPMVIDGSTARFGASVGVAFSTRDVTNPSEMLVNADLALYEAKENGRNCVAIFSSDLHEELLERKKLGDELWNALEADEFFTLFQPQVDAVDGRLIGVEALARWRHPTLGALTPPEFMPIAVELGAAHRIDAIVLEQALAVAGRIADTGASLGKISVNINAARLIEGELGDELNRLWTDRRVPLAVELLETAIYDGHDIDEWRFSLDRMRDQGVEVELDDFGSGRASITGLLRVRPDRIKLDRDLVAQVTADPVAGRIVSAIIDVAHAMEIGVIAVGVETSEHTSILRALGCDALQGDAIAPPMDVEALLDRLRPADDPSCSAA